jgi:cholesterol oxidase
MNPMRRQFGQQILHTAAGLGLQSVGAVGAMSAVGRSLAAGGLAASVAGAAQASATTQHVRALVVGTGYGGAVTAMRLAQRGIPVTLLEMGQLWNKPGKDGNIFCNSLKPDERAMWFSTQAAAVATSLFNIPIKIKVPYSAGVLDVLRAPNGAMDVYCGRGVGGGSLVNMAMLITPQREVLQGLMPTGFDVDDFLRRQCPKALGQLGANLIRPAYFEDSAYHRYARVNRAALARAGYTTDFLPSGYDFNYMEQEEAGLVPKSALGMEGGYGNNHGKRNLTKNYLADAVGTGLVSIRAMSSVKRIEQAPDGTYVVTVEEIDVMGNTVQRYELGCDHLFLAGGSMGTSEMLVRARETGTLPRLNSAIGTQWSANSDIFVVRGNPVWNPTGTKQSLVPATGFRTRDQDGRPVFSMNIPLPLVLESWANMNIVMTQNPELGSFGYDAATGRAVLKWNGQNAPAVRSAKFIFDRVNQAAGTHYRSDLFSGKTFADSTTYHPVGGCPLGKATDLFGRVAGHERLYVMDGALIPGALVANPALTVAALAERNIEHILQRDF